MQPAAFTPTWKGASGRLDHPRVALFGTSVVAQVQRPDPRASGPWGVARHKLGREEGQGRRKGTRTPANGGRGPQAKSSLSPRMQPAAFTPTRKAASGRLDPVHVALFGHSVVTQVQQPDPRQVALVAWLDPSPGGKRGGAGKRGRDPQQMAAGVLKPDQACLQECHQQHSRPLGRLLRGLDPHVWPFSGLAW